MKTETKIETVSVSLRPAKNKDLLVAPSLLKLGQIMYLKSIRSQKINGPFVIDRFVSPTAIEDYFNRGLVFVPLLPIDEDIHDVLQSKFKEERLKEEAA